MKTGKISSKRIKYVGFYTKEPNGCTRNGSLAATNKMDYVTGALNEAGYKVSIICPSWYADNRRGFIKEYTNIESEWKSVTYAPSYNASSRIALRVRLIYTCIWLFLYLLLNTKKNEDILVYHSLYLIIPVLLAKRIKKFSLVLETNEIYCDVCKYPWWIKKQEFKMLTSADKYLFSTELLNKKLNKQNKPYAVNYGTYQVERDRNSSFNDGKIHIVYAGIIDSQKGGAAAAVAAAEYLNDSYHIHIIGFGSEEDKKNLIDLIGQVTKNTKCKLTYDGILQGEEYIRFLQKCNIGLSTQTSGAIYNDTSFPSKVLSYLANGLRVVSVRIKAIEESKVAKLMLFYDKNTPQDIANAIKQIKISDSYDSREKIKEIHNLFVEELKKLVI